MNGLKLMENGNCSKDVLLLWYTLCRGIARIFQRGVTRCKNEVSHQIFMSFLPPLVGCLLKTWRPGPLPRPAGYVPDYVCKFETTARFLVSDLHARRERICTIKALYLSCSCLELIVLKAVLLISYN